MTMMATPLTVGRKHRATMQRANPLVERKSRTSVSEATPQRQRPDLRDISGAEHNNSIIVSRVLLSDRSPVFGALVVLALV
jgi:hypothetical protein